MWRPLVLHPVAVLIGLGMLGSLAIRKVRERFVDEPREAGGL